MPDIINPPLNIHVVAVIDKILQMVCIAALTALAKEYHSLADKDAPLWFFSRLVDQFVALPKRLNLFRDESVAILCRDGIEPFPDVSR